LNFVLHCPEYAASVFECMITHPAVRKCNFTGSTPVGRSIASRAAAALKPVLLELGGKNFAIVLEDADLEKAARLSLQGAPSKRKHRVLGSLVFSADRFQNGQICMSTDTVLVAKEVYTRFSEVLTAMLSEGSSDVSSVISSKSATRLRSLISDAEAKGGVIIASKQPNVGIPATIIKDITPSMSLFETESFGPAFGLAAFDKESEAVQIVKKCPFGLSAAIFIRDQFRALRIAQRLEVGAVHINGTTVHDESTLPHGGHGDSGWGRFGGIWGLEEFVQTKTIIMNE
jgi:acyl-CoA reductase-like NAD-dependent aldehyde dehydrogenase